MKLDTTKRDWLAVEVRDTAAMPSATSQAITLI